MRLLGAQLVGVPAITVGPANIGALSGPTSGWMGSKGVPVIVLLNAMTPKSDLIQNYLKALTYAVTRSSSKRHVSLSDALKRLAVDEA